MVNRASSLSRANSALRAERFEEAVVLYGEARRANPHLAEHIDFNLAYLSRILGEGEANPFVVMAADSVPSTGQLPKHDVLLIVLATSLREAGQTASLFSRRADYPVGILILVVESQGTLIAQSLRYTLGQAQARYALVVNEDSFPTREWLQHGVEGLRLHQSDAVYANAGGSIEPADQVPWMNLLAPPNVLISIMEDPTGSSAPPLHTDFLVPRISNPSLADGSDVPSYGEVHVVETGELRARRSQQFTREICVVMPCIDLSAGRNTADMLLRRSGLEADVVLAVDTSRQGFIRTLNQAARCSSAKYIVYLAEDAWPGEDWLRSAYERIRQEGKKLLAFNCGKWHGRVAAFGMVEKAWVFDLYGDQVLFEGYQSHRADNELTVIARAKDQFVYAPECVLMEHDVKKVFRRSERQAGNFRRADAKLFRERFVSGFDGVVEEAALEALHDEYLDLPSHYGSRPRLDFT